MTEMRELASQLKIHTIEGKDLLGIPGSKKITHAISITRDVRYSLWEWIKEENLNSTHEVFVIQSKPSYIYRGLDDNERGFLDILLSHMELAKKNFLQKLENKEFEKLAEGRQ